MFSALASSSNFSIRFSIIIQMEGQHSTEVVFKLNTQLSQVRNWLLVKSNSNICFYLSWLSYEMSHTEVHHNELLGTMLIIKVNRDTGFTLVRLKPRPSDATKKLIMMMIDILMLHISCLMNYCTQFKPQENIWLPSSRSMALNQVCYPKINLWLKVNYCY